MQSWISKYGVLIFACDGPVTKVNINPTVVVNGQPIGLSNPVFQGSTTDKAIVAYLPYCGQLNGLIVHNTGSGYTAPNFSASGVCFGPPIIKSNGGIQYVPVTGSVYFYALPDISVSDATGSGFLFTPVMSGPISTDVINYNASGNWLTYGSPGFLGSPHIPAPPVTINVPVTNFVGRLEDIFPSNPTMKAGFNLVAQPVTGGSVAFPGKNRYYQSGPWSIYTGNGTINRNPDYSVSGWNSPGNTIIRRWLYGTNYPNLIDSMGSPSQLGDWLMRYSDNNVNTPSGMWYQLQARNYDVVNLSGPNVGTTSGVAVDPRDIHMSNNGGIASITNNYTSLGSGYQGAVIRVAGSGIQFAAVVPTITSGLITSLTPVCAGIRASGKPNVLVYGTCVSGNQTTQIISVTYPNNVASWEIDIAIVAAQSQGIYQASGVCVTAPNGFTLQAQPPTDNIFDVDDTLKQALTTEAGAHPHVIRFMDSTQSWGGESALVDADDLPDPMCDYWKIQDYRIATFPSGRAVDTSAGKKVYGSQPYFNGGTDDYGNYTVIPSGDNGQFALNYGGYQNVVYELFGVKHPFKVSNYGQVWCNAKGGTMRVTNCNKPFAPYTLRNSMVWPTGPSSIILTGYVIDIMNTGVAWANPPQSIASTQPFDLTNSGASPGWQVALNVPEGNNCLPWEMASSICSNFGNCANWLNIPIGASDSLVQRLCDGAAAHAGSGEVWLELGNELWNGANIMITFGSTVNNLLKYAANSNGSVMNFPSGLGRPYSQYYGATTIIAAHAYDVFTEEWASQGRDPSKVKRIMGSWMNGPEMTLEILETAQQIGAYFDFIAVADYRTMQNDPVIIAEFNNWSARQINEFFRHWMILDLYTGNLYQQHINLCNYFGQPLRAMSLSERAPKSNSLLPADTHITICCTYVDANGLETTPGLSMSARVQTSAGDILATTITPWPVWAVSMNIYIQTSKMPLPVLYESLNLARITPGDTYLICGPLPTKYINPPTVNYAAVNNPIKPQLVLYEGGATAPVPSASTGGKKEHDCVADTSWVDVVDCWYRQADYFGVYAANYYQCYNAPSYDALWVLSYGLAQIPGYGENNLFCTSYGGYPNDGMDHNGGPNANEATGLQGWRNYVDACLTTEIMNLLHN